MVPFGTREASVAGDRRVVRLVAAGGACVVQGSERAISARHERRVLPQEPSEPRDVGCPRLGEDVEDEQLLAAEGPGRHAGGQRIIPHLCAARGVATYRQRGDGVRLELTFSRAVSKPCAESVDLFVKLQPAVPTPQCFATAPWCAIRELR